MVYGDRRLSAAPDLLQHSNNPYQSAHSPAQLNPYMEGSMSGANRGLYAMPRQLGGRASTSNSVAGISSFAFQGTNAHALIAPVMEGALASDAAAPPTMPGWQRQFISVLPPAHTQLRSVRVAGTGAARRAVLAMQLGAQACHAFFCDHQVSGKLIFPGKCWGACPCIQPSRITASTFYSVFHSMGF